MFASFWTVSVAVVLALAFADGHLPSNPALVALVPAAALQLWRELLLAAGRP